MQIAAHALGAQCHWSRPVITLYHNVSINSLVLQLLLDVVCDGHHTSYDVVLLYLRLCVMC